MARYHGDSKEILALSTFVKLVRATETVSGRVHSHLQEIDLTVSQFGVLETLYHLGPMCQRDIARKVLKSSGNITTVIGNLEKRGLVFRKRDENDRRYFNVMLTDEGAQILARFFPNHAGRITDLMNTLTMSEQQELGRLCKKLSGLG